MRDVSVLQEFVSYVGVPADSGVMDNFEESGLHVFFESGEKLVLEGKGDKFFLFMQKNIEEGDIVADMTMSALRLCWDNKDHAYPVKAGVYEVDAFVFFCSIPEDQINLGVLCDSVKHLKHMHELLASR